MKSTENCDKDCAGAGKDRPYRKGVDCVWCWLKLNSKKLSDAKIQPPKPIRSPACELLQVENVIDRRGQSCQHKWIIGCEKFGRCTTGASVVPSVADCPNCTSYVDPTRPVEPVRNHFDRIVMINLKRRTDRIEAFRVRQVSHGWELPEPTIFEAIEGNRVGVPSYYQAGGGAWGCLRSHVRILESAVMDGVGSILVLEDDVTWMSDSWGVLTEFMRNVPTNWDQLMLGGQLFHDSMRSPVAPGVLRVSNCQRTHAYAIRGDAMKDLLKLWYSCNTHIDHRMGPWQSDYKVYAPERFVFGQSEGKSDISGSRNPAKFWVPPSASRPLIYLTATKEVVAALRIRGFHTGHDREGTTDYDIGLVKLSHQSGHVRSSLLRKWLDTILWEVESMEQSVACLWHPEIKADEVRSLYSGEVVEIVADTADEAISKLPPGVELKQNYAASHIVHLTADRDTAETLSRLGFHIGNWRCPDSGHDHGLRKLAPLPHKVVPLSQWVNAVATEAAMMPNGVPTVWHPSVRPADVRMAAGGRKVIEIVASTAKDAVNQFREKR